MYPNIISLRITNCVAYFRVSLRQSLFIRCSSFLVTSRWKIILKTLKQTHRHTHKQHKN